MKTEDEAVELTESQFATAIPASVRRRFMQGRFESGADVVALRRFAPRLALWPGLCLTIVVYCLNMFGDAVRDLLDPRLRGGVGRLGA